MKQDKTLKFLKDNVKAKKKIYTEFKGWTFNKLKDLEEARAILQEYQNK